MSDLTAYQRAFARELREGLSGAMAPWLSDASALPHIAVYRNNYVIGVADALASAYPAVARLVGAKFFQAMAKAFIAAHPPRDTRLALYGGGFADFIESFEPAAKLPYLPDVARIERAWIEAHYAADAMPLTPKALAGKSPETIAALAPGLHGSARIIASEFPSLTIWSQNRASGDPQPIALDQGGETALVWRPGREVMTAPLSAGEASFLLNAAQDEPLGEAGARAIANDKDFNLAQAFGQWIQRGVFAAIDDEGFSS